MYSQKLYEEYWQGFRAYLNRTSSASVKMRETPVGSSWYVSNSNSEYALIGADIGVSRGYIQVKLEVKNPDFFQSLNPSRIEGEVGLPLKALKKDVREFLITEHPIYQAEDRDTWDSQFVWLAVTLTTFSRVFQPRIDAWAQEHGSKKG